MKKEVKKELDNILKHGDYDSVEEIYWWHYCRYQILSEDLIREFKDKVIWYNISLYQKLSIDFIWRFRDKLFLADMLYHNKISQQVYKELTKPKPLTRYEILDFS